MVKAIFKTALPILLCCAALGCKADLGGLFVSTDLDVRLKDKNNFKYLKNDELSNVILGDEYSFIVITDTHIEDGNAHGLEKIKDVIENNNNIKFVVLCGDITHYGGERDIKYFIEIARSLPVPAYPAIGNHDIYFDNWKVWKKHIGSTRYRVSADSADLFILDSANGFFGKEQIDWLEKEFKKTRGRVFLFSHHNFFIGFDKYPNIQQFSDTRERARVVSLLKGKCDIMFSGHSHERLVNETGGTLYVNIEDYIENKTYCLVTVTKTGVSYEFKKL